MGASLRQFEKSKSTINFPEVWKECKTFFSIIVSTSILDPYLKIWTKFAAQITTRGFFIFCFELTIQLYPVPPERYLWY